MSKNSNNWSAKLPAPSEKVFLGQTKIVADKHNPKEARTYEYWKLPGRVCQWVRK